MPKMKLILFTTSACHLCEQAQNILTVVLTQFPQLALELLDIFEKSQWQQRYAVKIPVLYHPNSQRELAWPFNNQDVITFINKLNNDNEQ